MAVQLQSREALPSQTRCQVRGWNSVHFRIVPASKWRRMQRTALRTCCPSGAVVLARTLRPYPQSPGKPVHSSMPRLNDPRPTQSAHCLTTNGHGGRWGEACPARPCPVRPPAPARLPRLRGFRRPPPPQRTGRGPAPAVTHGLPPARRLPSRNSRLERLQPEQSAPQQPKRPDSPLFPPLPPRRPTPGVVQQDKSSGDSVDTTKTHSDPRRVRMCRGREANRRRQRHTIRY